MGGVAASGAGTPGSRPGPTGGVIDCCGASVACIPGSRPGPTGGVMDCCGALNCVGAEKCRLTLPSWDTWELCAWVLALQCGCIHGLLTKEGAGVSATSLASALSWSFVALTSSSVCQSCACVVSTRFRNAEMSSSAELGTASSMCEMRKRRSASSAFTRLALSALFAGQACTSRADSAGGTAAADGFAIPWHAGCDGGGTGGVEALVIS